MSKTRGRAAAEAIKADDDETVILEETEDAPESTEGNAW